MAEVGAYTLHNRQRTYDTLTVLKAIGTVATAMVGENPLGTDTYYDTGGGFTEGNVVIRISTVPKLLASTYFTLRLQGGMNTSFSTIIDLQVIELGDATQISSGIDRGAAGEVIVAPFNNMYNDIIFRYLRHYITCGGTSGTGLAYEVFLTKK